MQMELTWQKRSHHIAVIAILNGTIFNTTMHASGAELVEPTITWLPKMYPTKFCLFCLCCFVWFFVCLFCLFWVVVCLLVLFVLGVVCLLVCFGLLCVCLFGVCLFVCLFVLSYMLAYLGTCCYHVFQSAVSPQFRPCRSGLLHYNYNVCSGHHPYWTNKR